MAIRFERLAEFHMVSVYLLPIYASLISLPHSLRSIREAPSKSTWGFVGYSSLMSLLSPYERFEGSKYDILDYIRVHASRKGIYELHGDL